MALFKDWDDLNVNGQMGDWCFFEGSDGLEYFGFRHPAPNNYAPEIAHEFRGELTHIPITIGMKKPNAWLWDGNRESPTISPSVDVVGVWHGFIRNGKLETA